MCMTAVSTRWNSGRLPIITPTVSPRFRPSLARPEAIFSTRSAYSPHVIETSSPAVRIATLSARSAAVTWKAAQIVSSLSALNSTRSRVSIVAIRPPRKLPRRRGLSHGEAVSGEPADVIRQADHEDQGDEHEADDARALHRLERNGPPADPFDDRPEDVAAVEREEREEVDDRERQRDQREDRDRVARAFEDRLARRLVGADHAGELLSLFLVDQLRGQRDRLLGHVP